MSGTVTTAEARPGVRPFPLWLTVAGRRMYARAWPAADNRRPPVVLVHGLVIAGDMVEPTARHLAGEFAVFAPDLPGFGASEAPPEPPRVGRLADSLAEWTRQAGLGRAVFVANSFGCQVAADLALRHPELVERLVLAAPTIDRAARSLGRTLRRWRREQPLQSAALRHVMIQAYARVGPRRAWQTVRAALADRIEEKLPFVDAPTLVVAGSADPIVPLRWAGELASRLPRGRLVVLPGAPHAMAFDAPARFAEAIRPFLSEAVTKTANDARGRS